MVQKIHAFKVRRSLLIFYAEIEVKELMKKIDGNKIWFI